MEQKVDWTALSIAIAIMVSGLIVGLIVAHHVFKFSAAATFLGGSLLVLFLALVIATALLKLYGKRRRTRSGRQWVVGLVIGPLGVGMSALVGSFAHQIMAGMIVGGIIFTVSTLYFLIGPHQQKGAM